ncbi:MAG TPA: glycosyltransferase family 4 protein [Thermoanaerobaculia bacterium]|nr:glycosyltransferase family 4 protein [Thermoanaerobaculia bacterium]
MESAAGRQQRHDVVLEVALKMRVALVVSGFPTAEKPSSGVFTLRAAQAIARQHDVDVFHLRAWRPGSRFSRTSVENGLPVTTLWLPQSRRIYLSRWRTSASIRASSALGWLLVRGRFAEFDVVHSVGAAYAGVLAAHWSRRARVPHVAQVIGRDANVILPSVREWPSIRGWERNVDTFLCNSEALREQVRSLYGAAAVTAVAYRGADLVRFSPPPEPRQGAGVRFFFAGGFPSYEGSPYGKNEKGGETICAAWSMAEEELTARGATLVLAGPGAAGGSVESWRRSLRDPEAVTLLGPIAPDAVAAQMRRADAVLVASMNEGLPNIAVEAAACGCAVAASRVGGIPEIVVDGETGLLLTPGVAAEWAAALVTLARDAQHVRTMGARARLHVERNFDASRYGDAIGRVYADLRERAAFKRSGEIS